ncbi:MAG: NAD-dependent epimerase/dehydratase family protein [Candidatus Micrarchaeia archaeon]
MIVLTGATGDLGGLVASKLLEKGFCVRLSSTSKKALEKRFGKSEKNRKELFELDFEKNCDFEELTKNADVVIHLAGQMTRHLPLNDARAIPSRIVNVNFKATKHLVESAKKSGVEKIVFSSSCSVTEKNTIQPIRWHRRLLKPTA